MAGYKRMLISCVNTVCLRTITTRTTYLRGQILNMSTIHAATGTSSLAATAEKKLLDQLQQFVRDESSRSIFALGGTIPIDRGSEVVDQTASLAITSPDSGAHSEKNGVADITQAVEPEADLSSPPVVIRWDTHQGNGEKPKDVTGRIQLPSKSPDNTGDLVHLVNSCQPATFGRGRVDVYDESYRKAGKLDPSDFSTNFNPYEFGIIDSIAKMLLPSVPGGPDAKVTCSRGIRAELYKLNVSFPTLMIARRSIYFHGLLS